MNQGVSSLEHPAYFQVDDGAGNVSYGCNQEWFGSVWQRMSGCGPSVAANIVRYLLRTGAVSLPIAVDGKLDCLRLMELVWRYVTPTMRGVYQTAQLSSGLQKFAQAHGFALESFTLNVPEHRAERPGLAEIVDFVAGGLRHDCPVAFLNLSNGSVDNLDNWHWVTVLSLEDDRQGGRVVAHIVDDDRLFPVDLKLWCETTKLGGGFVYFRRP